ncbi:TPA: hypothetical protein PXP39_000076 [Yersinia enterocolitica]|nr:hypothetical protein [Yersinia enterocolitica]HDL7830270.1 hypothetical protein [Yersinia enterocolitica]HDL7871126.1 hypothetical protein [Yersinia enterocolitica]HDL7884810.1 hypothetical protein [Yersinia enterocolitica]HDL7892302.1 hypothetical protein [Yersinia enterocolitica]
MKISQTATMTHQLWGILGYADLPDTSLLFTGEGQLPSAFPVTSLACASIATAGLARGFDSLIQMSCGIAASPLGNATAQWLQ